MRYLALIYGDEQRWEGLGDAERQAMYERYRAFGAKTRERGNLVEGSELRPTSTATTVRVRDGETLVTDGPFAELREQIGGYYVLDCDSIDEAVALAAGIPAVEHGAIEVRPGVEREDES
ncbi:MAG TPA: YciI family protein [Gaiellaceae bacterium]|nr:YciI family protein [Gaiellaceae bacterium]